GSPQLHAILAASRTFTATWSGEGDRNELGSVGRGGTGPSGAARGVSPRPGGDARAAGDPSPRAARSSRGRARERPAEPGAVPLGRVDCDRARAAGGRRLCREEGGEGEAPPAGPADGRTADRPGGSGPRRA